MARGSVSLRTFSAERFAGRYPLGKNLSPVISKAGTDFLRGDVATRVVGGACSEVLGGKNLAALLRPGFELEARAMAALEAGEPADVLSIHTSTGVPVQLDTFIQALAPHVPFEEDWCVNLQA